MAKEPVPPPWKRRESMRKVQGGVSTKPKLSGKGKLPTPPPPPPKRPG